MIVLKANRKANNGVQNQGYCFHREHSNVYCIVMDELRGVAEL